MGLKEAVLDYVRKKCEEEGLDTKPRIYRIARDLNADVNEVINVVKGLEREGLIKYAFSSDPSESHICPAVSPEEMLEIRIVGFVKEKGKTEIYEIARMLGEDKNKVIEAVKKLQEKGRLKFVGEAGSSWIEYVG